MKHLPINGWEWIFYIYGWITGALSLLFWAIMILFYFINKEREFFGTAFHRRVLIWGIVMGVLTLFGLIIGIMMVLLVPILITQGLIASI